MMDKSKLQSKAIERGKIVVQGAREHNLRDVSVTIPRNSLTVVTGLSGSGKSSLAFDTIYAEGNRRYLETFSSYARGFIGDLERPDVDEITGLSPVISIEQKTTNKNPRSTVGTTTEIYDFLRLLYARCATAYSLKTGKPLVQYTESQIIEQILETYADRKIYLYAPVVRARKGHYRELLESYRRKGYISARIDGELTDLTPGLALSRYQNHSIEILIDKLKVVPKQEARIRESVTTALKVGKGMILVEDMNVEGSIKPTYFSRNLMDEEEGESLPDPDPNTFSFNSPQGSCPKCKGLGVVTAPDLTKVIPDPKLSMREGGIVPIGKYKKGLLFAQMEAILKHHDADLDTPIKDYPEELMDDILNGADYPLFYHSKTGVRQRLTEYDGIVSILEELAEGDFSAKTRRWAEQFHTYVPCPKCHGKRLRREALAFRIDDKDITELSALAIPDLLEEIRTVPGKIDKQRRVVATEICKEIESRLAFLVEVGLTYISLDRMTATLSGGEMQRIRLATQLGSRLVNVLYILDEPSIGLHQRDNDRLIRSLKSLRDQGNTILVVEHDREIMEQADYIIDIGPGAGRKGGEIVFSGTPEEMMKADTLTAQYIRREKDIEIPKMRRSGSGKSLVLTGATGNNLHGEPLSIPLGTLTLITGVSGSGKSTYINDTLYPALSKKLYRALTEPLPFDSIEGMNAIDKVVQVDQSPIGRTPRSNPATYTGVFTDIRNLFTEMPEAKIRGYKPGRFSFNVKGGRCEECKGNGYRSIEMHFLPDVYVPCEVCRGKRYNRETLEVRYKGQSIADVLDMTVNQAVDFFEGQSKIRDKIKVLQDVGLGYIKLGQSSSTLSGGECQRIKLASELNRRDTGKTVYFLDEPTTGLHFEDIRMLMAIVNRLVDRGNTVVIIEHNLDVIKIADHIIDIGPEGGKGGGHIIFEGTPEEMIRTCDSHTAKYLREEFRAAKREI